jgi:radical SAM superfamily enzyme
LSKKFDTLNKIDREFEQRNSWQGKFSKWWRKTL